MNSLEIYYKQIIKHDLINKFNYDDLTKIPELKKIILNFGCKNFEIKKIATALLALKLISSKKCIVTKANKSNIKLKIRKGHPVGCLVILQKRQMYNFFFKLVTEIFPKLKDFKGIALNKKITKSFSFTIQELIVFNELEAHFYLFTQLPSLNITIITNTVTNKELKYLLNSFKLPLLQK